MSGFTARSEAQSATTSASVISPVKSSKPVRFTPTSPSATKQVPRRVVSTNTVRRVSATSSPMLSPASSTRSAARPRRSDERSSSNQRADRRVSPACSKTITERTPSPDLPGVSEVSMVYQGRQTEALPEEYFMEEVDTTLGMAPAIAVDLSTPPKPSISQPGCIDSRASNSPVHDSPVFLTPDGRHPTSTPPRQKFGSNGKPFPPGVMQVSPMRAPAARLSMPTSAEAQEFLRNVVRDAMFEREEEQREELRALHLDMVKMGRAWKVTFNFCPLSTT
jgi:protein NEDD1